MAMESRITKAITTASRMPAITDDTIRAVRRYLTSSGEKVPGRRLFLLLADRYRYRLMPKNTSSAVGIAKNRRSKTNDTNMVRLLTDKKQAFTDQDHCIINL